MNRRSFIRQAITALAPMVFVPQLAGHFRWKQTNGIFHRHLENIHAVHMAHFPHDMPPQYFSLTPYQYEVQLRMVRTFFFGETIIGSVEL